MSGNSLINQISRMMMGRLTRIAMNFGIDKGSKQLAKRGKPTAQMTKTERRQAQNMSKTTRNAVKRARQAARITRRLGR